MYMNFEGEWEKLTPRKTFWCMYYLNSFPADDAYFEKKFRSRFRIPYDSFIELLSDIKIHPLFKRWHHKRVDTSVKLGLLLLGSLHYLGRGWTLDDLEEATSISQHVHRDFLEPLLSMVKTIYIQNMLLIHQQQMPWHFIAESMKCQGFMEHLDPWMPLIS